MIPLLILGLLIQNPEAHGYELLAQMEERHMNDGHWQFKINKEQRTERRCSLFLFGVEIIPFGVEA